MKIKLVFSLLVFLITLEVALRVTGLYSTNEEKQGFEYEHKYNHKINSWFHTWSPNSTLNSSSKEFQYTNKYNDLGHREVSTSVYFSKKNVTRVLCIGDSFTEGDGAPYDSTWVKRAEEKINNASSIFSFYNAGVCGADLFYDYKILSCKLIQLKPNVVIEALNYSDVNDVIFRGGDERFNPDSTTTYKNGPSWEIAYQHSHVIRAIVTSLLGYNKSFIKKANVNKEEELAIKQLKQRVHETNEFCKKRGVFYFLVIHPHPLEINKKSNKITEAFYKEPYVINLFNDFYPFFKENDIAKYSWRKNQHFNSKGYWVMGDAIASHLLKLEPFNTIIKIK